MTKKDKQGRTEFNYDIKIPSQMERKKLNQQPLNRDIGQSLFISGSIQNKTGPEQYYLLSNLSNK